MAKTTFSVDGEKLQVTIERVFDAPRELVWRALSDPKMVAQWWGPAKYKTVVNKMDFKVGGEWRYVQSSTDGDFGFHGVYKEIKPMEKITDTFNFEGFPGDHEMTETMTLQDLGGGKTKARSIAQFKNKEDLDGMVSSGMETGAVETWERLAGLIATLK